MWVEYDLTLMALGDGFFLIYCNEEIRRWKGRFSMCDFGDRRICRSKICRMMIIIELCLTTAENF